MKALKFTLKGQTAFFKKPDVNTYVYFTYSHIHKVALLGIIGAILGLGGYNNQDKAKYPEFYERLKDLKISIVPINGLDNEYRNFDKKIQTFNNSVGYASQEEGGNLIVNEQWIEKPIWDIYLLEEHALFDEIKRRLVTNQYVYMPYLGKNDHPATIYSVEEIELRATYEIQKIDSLFLQKHFEAIEEEDDYLEDDKTYYKYQEKLPIDLEESTNQYLLESFMITNRKMKSKDNITLYLHNNRVLHFF